MEKNEGLGMRSGLRCQWYHLSGMLGMPKQRCNRLATTGVPPPAPYAGPGVALCAIHRLAYVTRSDNRTEERGGVQDAE
jgi:hypothetical protein